MITMQTNKLVLSFFFMLICLTSCRNDFDDSIRQFSSMKIVLPYDRMERIICSPFADTITDNKALRLVNFIDTMQCHSCEMNRLIEYERLNIARPELKRLEFVYVINTSSQNFQKAKKLLQSLRIGGSVYLDTCNVFRHVNPNFPDNKMFHSFVLNRDGKIILVGNPFQNDKMHELLMKIVKIDSCQTTNKHLSDG